MEQQKQNQRVENYRFIGVIVATALLNIGLYFMFSIFAPLIAGIICGYLLQDSKRSMIGGFVGAFIAYVPLELISAPAQMENLVELGILSLAELEAMLLIFYLLLILAATIISILGIIGGYIGAKLRQNAISKPVPLI